MWPSLSNSGNHNLPQTSINFTRLRTKYRSNTPKSTHTHTTNETMTDLVKFSLLFLVPLCRASFYRLVTNFVGVWMKESKVQLLARHIWKLETVQYFGQDKLYTHVLSLYNRYYNLAKSRFFLARVKLCVEAIIKQTIEDKHI